MQQESHDWTCHIAVPRCHLSAGRQETEGYSSACLCPKATKGQHSQNEILAVGCGLDNCLAEVLLRTGPSTSWQHSHLGQSRHCSLYSTGSCRQLQVRSSCTAKVTPAMAMTAESDGACPQPGLCFCSGLVCCCYPANGSFQKVEPVGSTCSYKNTADQIWATVVLAGQSVLSEWSCCQQSLSVHFCVFTIPPFRTSADCSHCSHHHCTIKCLLWRPPFLEGSNTL